MPLAAYIVFFTMPLLFLIFLSLLLLLLLLVLLLTPTLSPS